MANKVNVANLLKNCPEGMELDCTMFDNLFLNNVNKNDLYPIMCYTICDGIKNRVVFTEFGEFNRFLSSKCVIFPKGKTTWEGFTPPCNFKDGDVIYTDNFIAILSHIAESGAVWYHCYYCISTKNFNAKHYCGIGNINNDEFRLATEEEKEKLFQVIKDNGYKWNPKTKTLEKLIEPKFKVGDRIKKVKGYISGIITNISDDGSYRVAYQGGGISYIHPAYQYEWELVPNKFDINTLVPFESRVLVRSDKSAMWKPAIYGIYRDSLYWMIGGSAWTQCIPYEGNEHLLGTTDDCDEYFKIWL